MPNPESWVPNVQAALADDEESLAMLAGLFMDKPKSMRLGLLAATNMRLLFYRKKFLGEEWAQWAYEDVASVELGDIRLGEQELVDPRMTALRIHLKSGMTLEMSMPKGDPEEFVEAVQTKLPSE